MYVFNVEKIPTFLLFHSEFTAMKSDLPPESDDTNFLIGILAQDDPAEEPTDLSWYAAKEIELKDRLVIDLYSKKVADPEEEYIFDPREEEEEEEEKDDDYYGGSATDDEAASYVMSTVAHISEKSEDVASYDEQSLDHNQLVAESARVMADNRLHDPIIASLSLADESIIVSGDDAEESTAVEKAAVVEVTQVSTRLLSASQSVSHPNKARPGHHLPIGHHHSSHQPSIKQSPRLDIAPTSKHRAGPHHPHVAGNEFKQ